jgi:hypothetical protein
MSTVHADFHRVDEGVDSRRSSLETRVWIVAGTLTLLLFLAGLGWFLFGAFDHDASDAYGHVAIPGSARLHLPKGEVDVAYREVSPFRRIGGLPVPRVGLSVTSVGGSAPDPTLRRSFGSTVAVNGDAHRRVFRMRVERAGDYRVRADGAAGHDGTQFLFGHRRSLLPRVIAPLAAIAAVWLIALILIRSIRRRNPEPSPGPRAEPVAATGGVRVVSVSGAGAGDVAERLRRLDELHAQQAITDEEYAAERARIIDSV